MVSYILEFPKTQIKDWHSTITEKHSQQKVDDRSN